MRISLESPDQPEVISLIEELDAYQSSLYPPESNNLLDVDTLSQADVIFAVVRNAQHEAIACGAVVVYPDYGEIKRLFVRPENRGEGIAKKLLSFLENEAAGRGCKVLMLETGISQPEALGLYARTGYIRRGSFAEYTNDPFSVFMEKQIAD